MNTKLAIGVILILITTSGRADDRNRDKAAAAQPSKVRTPEAPSLSPEHRAHLMRIARRTLSDAVLGRESYEPAYVPDAVGALELEVVVRLRERGFLFAAGAAGPSPVALGVRDAALLCASSVLGQDETASDLLADPLIEIELVGAAEPIPFQGNWTRPRAVDAYFEPGVDGMIIDGTKSRHRFCPSELITSGMVLPEVLAELARRTHTDRSELDKTRLSRFRSLFIYQSSVGEPVITLRRGMTVIPSDYVTRSNVDRTIERLAEYMVYRQLESGLFTYLYDAAADRYVDEDNLVRQVGAALAICTYAEASGRSAAEAACESALRFHLKGLREIPGRDDAAFIATADQKHKLGVTALLSLALGATPNSERYRETRARLINGMLSLQRESGMFVTAFPPAVEVGAQDYFPGEALLAMADAYLDQPDGSLVDAFDRAINFYRDYFRDRPSPAFVPWQVQAYAAVAPRTQRDDYIAFVFELTDWLLENQITPANSQWPEMWGGIASYQPGRAGIATASYLEGMCDALQLARITGDTARAERYVAAVRQATRFVIQLQMRPEEAYFVRSPRDAVWGMRTSPALNLLRIDHVQHALLALMKARDVLFPQEPKRR